jgi:osmoprotectant transport system permease protein
LVTASKVMPTFTLVSTYALSRGHEVTVLAASCLADRHAWICGDYLRDRSSLIQHSLYQHITLTALSLGLALVVAIPLTLISLRPGAVRGAVMGLLGVIYTIPSLALFVLLQPVFGITHVTPVVIALVAYAQLLLVRNILVGLDGVPEESVEAARGLGYGPARLMLQVRLPLALPAILAGLRITTVSTIALLTVGGVIEKGGRGQLLFDGFQDDRYAQILTGLVLIVALGLIADVLLLLLQRSLTRWERVRA